MIDALIYSFLLFVIKKYFLKKMSLEMYMVFSSFISFLLLIVYFALNKKAIMTPKNIKGAYETFIPLVVVCIIGSLNWYLYNYLIRETKLSKLIPLNELFIILFSTAIGIYFLNEKIKPINIVGIIGGIISIQLIHK